MIDTPCILTDHLRNPGLLSLDGYQKAGGFAALSKAVKSLGRAGVLDQIRISGLRGRGGSVFPSSQRWSAVARALCDEKFILMNGEEGGPGGFKDRMLLDGTPFLILEGVILSGFAVGAGYGFCLIRRDFGEAISSFKLAAKALREAGLLGQDILGSGYSFDISVVTGAGMFSAGEETALLESLEGRRGNPRPTPATRFEHGFRGKPTLLASAETFANIPFIVKNGGEWFSQIGLSTNPGTRLFSVSGHIAKPGVYEAPLGTPISRLLEMAGGAREGEEIVAVLPGGVVSGFIPKEKFSVGLDQEALLKEGSNLGLGAVIVFSNRCCFVNVAQCLAAFLEQESCGHCTPCREGTKKLHEILSDIGSLRRKSGESRRGQCREVQAPRPFELLEPLLESIAAASACGFGRSAGLAVSSAMRLFPEEFAAHFQRQECPKRVCWG